MGFLAPMELNKVDTWSMTDHENLEIQFHLYWQCDTSIVSMITLRGLKEYRCDDLCIMRRICSIVEVLSGDSRVDRLVEVDGL